jgi:hypothetical protein
LKAEQQVCKLALTLLAKEVGHAHESCHAEAGDGKLRAGVFPAGGGARAGGGVAFRGRFLSQR